MEIIRIIKAIFSHFQLNTSPISILITLYNLRVLGNGKWLDYSMFRAIGGINSLFHWSAAESLMRYSRRGVSPYIGDGNYEFSRLFNFSLPSIYIYRFANNICIVVGLFSGLVLILYGWNLKTAMQLYQLYFFRYFLLYFTTTSFDKITT